MIVPPKLKKNDTVAILATARKIDRAEIQEAVALLESWGLRVQIGDTIGLEECQFAGTDFQRAAELQKFLDDPNIKAIWCARGGYGTVRIIDNIDFSKFQVHPKWIIGFSDITVLHSQLHLLEYCTLHATMPLNIAKNSYEAINSLRSALFDHNLSYEVYSIKGHVPGEAQGQLIGGNLSILYGLLGSPSAIETSGKILFLEDLDEYLYHVDRMMMNLKRNAYFDYLNGLIIGSFSDMHDNKIPFGHSVRDIVLDIVGPYDIPIVFDFPAGHLDDNRALLFGADVSLQVKATQANLNFDFAKARG